MQVEKDSREKERVQDADYVRIPQSWLSLFSQAQLKNAGRRHMGDKGVDLPADDR